jgi:two-component system OmpR family response regulator
MTLDAAARELRVDGQAVDLTRTEFDVLGLLLERPGRVQSRAQIIDRVRSDDVHITERTIDTHVRRIRAKLRPLGLDPIETVHGVGYKVRGP